jgi:peptidoglycan-N-acetylglucosamine deacetylase
MYLARTPSFLKPLYRDLLWHMPRSERVVYMTFDDGPIPEVTPWVLDRLAEHGAKATFFCIGRNALDQPGILARIVAEGHAVGNHTWDHRKGWGCADRTYLRTVLQADAVLGSTLFRPPYGRITRSQAASLRKRFQVVMWDVLSGDFDTSIDGARCVRNVLDHVRPGSIIVFHDSLKAEPRLRVALPIVLDALRTQGYLMKALPGHRP